MVTKVINFERCNKCKEYPSIKVVNYAYSDHTRYRATCSCREEDLENMNFHFLEDAAAFWNKVVVEQG